MDAGTAPPDIDDLPNRMVRLENSAFDAFAAEFGPRFRAYFLRRSLRLSEAEDLAASCVQDISLKVAQSQFVSQGTGSFETWVFTLLHHAFVDWLRKPKPAELQGEEKLETPLFGSETDPDDDVCAAVAEALDQISEVDRAIIALRDMENELTYEEIGQELHLATGTVRVRHHRALKRMKGVLSQHPTIRRLLDGEKRWKLT